MCPHMFLGATHVFSVHQVFVIYSVKEWKDDWSLPKKNKIDI